MRKTTHSLINTSQHQQQTEAQTLSSNHGVIFLNSALKKNISGKMQTCLWMCECSWQMHQWM